jgi:hypothetical protein
MNYFILYSNVIISNGFKRKILIDLQRNKVYEIPNIYLNEINNHKIEINDLKKKFNTIEFRQFENFFNFLIQNELGFFSKADKTLSFSSLNLKFHEENTFSNAVIEFEKYELVVIILQQLINIKCNNIAIIFEETGKINVNQIKDLYNDKILREFYSIDIFIDYSIFKKITLGELANNIRLVTVFNVNESERLNSIYKYNRYYFTQKHLQSIGCGVIQKDSLVPPSKR